MKTFLVRTLGCKVNQYESELIRREFLSAGFKEAVDKTADVYIINTCTVTQKADNESRSLIHWAASLNPLGKIYVIGCCVDNNPGDLKAMPAVSGVLVNRQKGNLLKIVLPRQPNASSSKVGSIGINRFKEHTRAFLKIQDGCNNYCSYCIIPKVRGRSQSRELSLIRKEARCLAENGYKEIVLCGICLGAYGRDLKPRLSLIKVIEALEKIPGLLRIRLSSIEASDVSDDLIRKLAGSKKFCRHLHIPFQSGDDKILKLMNRKLSSADYLDLIQKLRNAIPDIGITTDVMTGFPQEDKGSFKNTVNFLGQAKPSRIHVFPFSRRAGTLAFNFSPQINREIVKERVRKLRVLGSRLSADFSEKFIGSNLSVLIEAKTDSKTGYYKGYSDNYVKVYIRDKRGVVGNSLIKARVIKIYKDGLVASAA